MNIDKAWDMIGTAINDKNSAEFDTALIEVRNHVAIDRIALHNIAVLLDKAMAIKFTSLDDTTYMKSAYLDKIKVIIDELKIPLHYNKIIPTIDI